VNLGNLPRAVPRQLVQSEDSVNLSNLQTRISVFLPQTRISVFLPRLVHCKVHPQYISGACLLHQTGRLLHHHRCLVVYFNHTLTVSLTVLFFNHTLTVSLTVLLFKELLQLTAA
jgi:hypothetical protein